MSSATATATATATAERPASVTVDEAVAAFGWDGLRPHQQRAVDSVLDGRDTLVLMPTGSGKSAVYQVAGAVLGKPVVVVSPLVALQEDQVAGIAEHPDAPQAAAVNSTHGVRERREAWDALESGDVRYLFVAPEQLADDEVVARLAALDIGLVVVDEAHCVSSWGHDFRPDYLLLGEVVERLGRPTVLAMTATGSPPVHEDIVRQLGMRDPETISGGFDRPEIRLEVRRHEDQDAKNDAVVEQVRTAEARGIVYVATRKGAEALAARIADAGVSADVYHAGLANKRREEVHRAFRAHEVDVVVATSAFGMGIDEPDLRFVVHADVPESLDALHQEIGRAGRDGQPAVATLHYRAEDIGLRRFFASGGPRPATLRAVFGAVPEHDCIARGDLAEASGLAARTATRGAVALVEAGVLVDDIDGFRRSEDATTADDAVARTKRRAEQREHIEESRIDMARRYAERRGCRRQFLLGYFGQNEEPPCGNCDVCIERPDLAEGHAEGPVGEQGWTPDTAVEHAEWGTGTVMDVEEDRITVFFEQQGYRTLSLHDVEERGLLTKR